MGLAASDQETRQRLREDRGVGLGAASVQVAERLADVTAVSDGASKLSRGPAGSTRCADWH
jgi:hypothetical protein